MCQGLCFLFSLMVMMILGTAWVTCGEKDLCYGFLMMIPIGLAITFIYPFFEDWAEKK